MIAKGEIVLAPVQQQDLAFLMQSGKQAVYYTHLGGTRMFHSAKKPEAD